MKTKYFAFSAYTMFAVLVLLLYCVLTGSTKVVLPALCLVVFQILLSLRFFRNITPIDRPQTDNIFDTLFYENPGVLSVSDATSGLIIDVNENFENFFGYRREELVGRKSEDMGIWHSYTDRERVIASLKQDAAAPNIQATLKKKNGELCIVSAKTSLININGRDYFVAAFFDISDLKETENRIKEFNRQLEFKVQERTVELVNSLNRLKRITDNLNEAQSLGYICSWELNIVTKEFTWSDQTYILLGETADHISPSLDTLLSYIEPHQRSLFGRDEAKNNTTFEVHILRKNGEVRFCSAQKRIHRDEKGNVTHITGIIQDNTESYLLNKEKQKITDALIARSKEIEQFAYIISHNLRTPVANIIALVETLKDTPPGSSDFTEFNNAIEISAWKLDEIISDLNKILTVKQDVSEIKEWVDLDELMKGIELSISSVIQKEKVVLEWDFSVCSKIYTIKSYMHSILFNLVSNSIKYRKPTESPRIKIEATCDDNRLEIRYADNGLGMDLVKYGDDVFKLFKRFHFHTEGKGMGLYMIKNQVETLGGSVALKSMPGSGTEFMFQFDKARRNTA